jgi:catechol-2,3-dioxygenase
MQPQLATLDHIHVSVADRTAAEAWYRRVLHLERVERLAFWTADHGPLTLASANDQVHIALFERPPEKSRTTVAFGVGGAELLAWQRHLAAELGRELPLVDHTVSWSLYFQDPDGNPFEITSYDYDLVLSQRTPESR